MKKLLGSLLAGLICATSVSYADNVIVTETTGWKEVPIVVDDTAHTYTYEGTLPEGNYYYSYKGYRCIREKRDVAGVDLIFFKAAVTGGSDIYCYPVP